MTALEKYEIAKKIADSPWFIKRNVTHPKSLTLKYIFYRIFRPLLKLNYKAFKWSNPVTPWTTQASIKIFKRLLDQNMIGFEYGSGKSSMFLAKKIKHLISVEHNEKWYAHIRKTFEAQGISNVDYHFIPPRIDVNEAGRHTFHDDFSLDAHSFHVMKEYHNYFSFIKQFPNDHFDFILIDGRARVECALNGFTKLKKHGMFVLDNSDRERYKPIFKVLEKWPSITTTTGLFDTTIWFKP